MANLPANRTKLNSAISDQSQSVTPASGKANREALLEAYDTIDFLYQDYLAYKAGINRVVDGGNFTDTSFPSIIEGGTFI